MIHFRLAELQTEIELLRAGIYQATDSFLAGNISFLNHYLPINSVSCSTAQLGYSCASFYDFNGDGKESNLGAGDIQTHDLMFMSRSFYCCATTAAQKL